jgi:hypothetical protein
MYALIIYLLVFLSAIGRKDRNRKHSDAEASKDSRHPLPDFSIPVVSIPPTTTNQEAPKHKKAKSHHWIRFLVEWAGLTVLGFYAGFITSGWHKGKNSITPLVFILVAYMLGLIRTWWIKDDSREQVDSVQERVERRGTIKFWVEIAGVVLLAIYAGFTIAGWWEVKRQVDTMRNTSERAWIKFTEETFTLERPISFGPAGGPQDFLPTLPFSRTSIDVNHTFHLENFGKLPARSYSIWTQPFYMGDGHMDNWTYEVWEQTTCDIARGNLNGMIEHEPGLWGKVMFPGSTAAYSGGYLFVPNTVHNIEFINIGVCLVYQDVNGDIHHTAVLYCQIEPDLLKERDRKPTKMLDQPEVWWKFPETRFEACEADAD